MTMQGRAAYEEARKRGLVGQSGDWTHLGRDIRAGWDRVARAVWTAPSWELPPLCPEEGCGHPRASHGLHCEAEGCKCKRRLHSLPRTQDEALDDAEQALLASAG
jgi:hypothetical protein